MCPQNRFFGFHLVGCAPNQFFGFHSASAGFFEEKTLKTVFGTSFPVEKVIFIFVGPHSNGEKWSRLPKIIFHGYLGKYCLFQENSYMKTIQNFISYKKDYIDFCCQTTPSLQNGHVLPQIVFRNFFNIHEVLLLESILFRKKILWRINMVLIKFSLNVLLFEKLRNECKILPFFQRLCVLSRTTQVQLPSFTFVACNYGGLWHKSSATRLLETDGTLYT